MIYFKEILCQENNIVLRKSLIHLLTQFSKAGKPKNSGLISDNDLITAVI